MPPRGCGDSRTADARAVITFIPTLVVGGWVGWWLAKPRTDATKRRAGR